MLASISWGEIAAIVAAAAWALVALFIGLMLVNVFRVLESTKVLIDGITQETVPLLGEVKTTVEGVNKQLDHVDGLMTAAGRVAQRVDRVTTILEQTTSSPLMKVAAAGAGFRRGVRRFNKKKRRR